ncbi:MAG: zinc ribbon domain-containing protein [Promethearchaeota archaeon]
MLSQTDVFSQFSPLIYSAVGLGLFVVVLRVLAFIIERSRSGKKKNKKHLDLSRLPPVSRPFASIGAREQENHAVQGDQGDRLQGVIICTRCGYKNEPDSIYCGNCGFKLVSS